MSEVSTTTLAEAMLELQSTGIKIAATMDGRYSVLGRGGNHVDTVNSLGDAVSLARKLRDEVYNGGQGAM